jgi:hypothetical protein
MSDALLRKADRFVGRVRFTMAQAFNAGRNKVSTRYLIAALRANDVANVNTIVDGAIDTMQHKLESTLPDVLLQVLIAGGKVAERELPTFRTARRTSTPAVKARFDMKNPRAIRWARERGAKLVTDITQETRGTIRRIISAGLDEGIAPRESALLIRESVGLTDAQSDAVLRLNRKIVESPGKVIKAGKIRVRVPLEGMSRAKLDSVLTRYSDRLLKQRSETIARTETITASNAGQREMWLQARDKGLLAPTTQREWIATASACDTCQGLNGTLAPLDGLFEGGYGGPAAHPRCRCTTSLVFQ